MTTHISLLLAVSALFPAWMPSLSAADLQAPLRVVRAVGPEGRGNAEAAAAWREITRAGGGDLPVVLAGMDGANALAENWLRAAVETIAARELAGGRPLPMKDLEDFVADRRHSDRARRLALDFIVRVDSARGEQLITGMLDDPANAIRRDAVQLAMKDAAQAAAAGNASAAKNRYRAALLAAREADQVDAIAKSLRDLGETVDLQGVFGWVTEWKVVGPFDNSGRGGFAIEFPPERELKFDAEYEGKGGPVRWRTASATNEYGMVDLNVPLGALKEVCAYACADFVATKAQPAEIRLGCQNAWKVWFNGKLLFGRDEYHRGMEIDQYRLPVELQAGRNTILVKLCQNEQREEWTVGWEFQLRVTDAQGTPIVSVRENIAPASK
jgi:hypothetical protein